MLEGAPSRNHAIGMVNMCDSVQAQQHEIGTARN
jgi:hypothetical protein